MLDILAAIGPLFLIILLGAGLRSAKVVDDSWETTLNAFALKIGLPALIINALANAHLSFVEEWRLLLANSLFILGIFVAVLVLGKLFHTQRSWLRTLFFSAAFGNVAYLGIPILERTWESSNALSIASLLVAIYLFWIFTLGTFFLEYSCVGERDCNRNFWQRTRQSFSGWSFTLRIIKNPLLISLFVGLLFGMTPLQIPQLFAETIEILAASVTPLVLFVIGLFLGRGSSGKIMDWMRALFFALVTLLLWPTLFLLGLSLTDFPQAEFFPSILMTAMPLAITPFALADDYGMEKAFIARTIIVSTFLSPLTISFWIFFLG